ncbi:8-oxoguanine DNA glycosylase [Hamiltosporidium tvaerminnensis]|uniref:DNA-(apurinic or apyrimidinic site) lyase n=1 Tax=Hamiltosporidium tvaerminnensis TaxID=1176355 RepID=A0A4Q9LZL2_9MICR|nr:8-oxoguanine DNA glycosylase [Hamiltosporidium tvaerminnensis]
MQWYELKTNQYINLRLTLFSGQCFNFKEIKKDLFAGVISDDLFFLKELNKTIYFNVFNFNKPLEIYENILNKFFILKIDYRLLCFRWKNYNLIDCECENFLKQNDGKYSNLPPNYQITDYLQPNEIKYEEKENIRADEKCSGFDIYLHKKMFDYCLAEKGLRLLNLDILLTIFSFICSSNNNIKRIEKMVDFLYSKGEFITEMEGFKFYTFPSLQILYSINIEELNVNKFGYRSKYIIDCAKYLLENDFYKIETVFESKIFLKVENIFESKDFEITEEVNISKNFKSEIRNNLIKIPGIGKKVADCICLMGFKFLDICPIDIHIYKWSVKTFEFKFKNLNDKNYSLIQEEFKKYFGKYSGIAQLFIFKSSLDKKVLKI